jgi:hypothetical protein
MMARHVRFGDYFTVATARHERGRLQTGETPIIAIEMGVDEDVSLADDIDKLLNSEIPHGYIVHFLRESYPDRMRESCRSAGRERADHICAALEWRSASANKHFARRSGRIEAQNSSSGS